MIVVVEHGQTKISEPAVSLHDLVEVINSAHLVVKFIPLIQIDSELARQLEFVMSIEGDIQQTLPGLDFSISTSHSTTVDLIEGGSTSCAACLHSTIGGSSVLVNQANKQEFTQAYARYLLCQTVDVAFEVEYNEP